jgi:Flp pilus assembly protein TadB
MKSGLLQRPIEPGRRARSGAARQRERDWVASIARRVDILAADVSELRMTDSRPSVGARFEKVVERYHEEYEQQRETADRWRLVALSIGALAAILVFLATVAAIEAATAGRLGLAATLGGIAAYAARQSARHRRREECARARELELIAFPAVLDTLPAADRFGQTIRLARFEFAETDTRGVAEIEAGRRTQGPVNPRGPSHE